MPIRQYTLNVANRRLLQGFMTNMFQCDSVFCSKILYVVLQLQQRLQEMGFVEYRTKCSPVICCVRVVNLENFKNNLN